MYACTVRPAFIVQPSDPDIEVSGMFMSDMLPYNGGTYIPWPSLCSGDRCSYVMLMVASVHACEGRDSVKDDCQMARSQGGYYR